MSDANATDSPEQMTEGTTGPDDLSPLLTAIQAPISDEAPTGESVTYDEDFRTVKTHIDNIGSVGSDTDYETIADLSRTILTEKSKDLRAAGYLVIGEAWSNGAESMAEALRGVRLLIDTYWEDLYPAKRRMRGRGSALQFVSDRLSDWIASTDFERTDRAALVAAEDALQDIQEFGLQEMGEHAPSLSGLLKDLEKAIGSLPKPEPEVEPDAGSEPETDETDGSSQTDSDPSPSQHDRSSSSSTSGPSDVASESDATTAVTRAAAFLREQDLTNPTPYRLLRASQWGALRDPPPDDGGETRLDPPREQRRMYLSGLLEDGEYETLLREGESSFQGDTFFLWLDLQRLVASALDALGTPYKAAHEAVMTDVAHLIRRLPVLPSLSYSDGTPFASPFTKDWIETKVRPILGDTSDDSSGETDSALPVAEQYEEARERLGQGNLDEALALMHEGASEDASEKESFHRRLYMAQLCMKGKQPTVARSLLDELDSAVEEHALDVWNPELALEMWTTRCRCYDALAQEAPAEKTESLRAKANDAFENVCQVDVTKAIELRKERSQHR